MVVFSADERDDFTFIEFELPEGVIAPGELAQALVDAPEIDPRKGVVISGRGPVWLFGALVHIYHATAWVATFDPRLGAVVVETHTPNRKVGEVVLG